MKHARALGKLLALAATAVVFYPMLLSGAALARLRRRPDGPWRARMLSIVSRRVTRILGIRLSVKGGPPQQPFLLVSNHLGYVDVMLLASLAEGVFVARGDLAGWPVLGPITRAMGTIYLDRENRRDLPRVSRLLQEALEEGLGVFLFPEGTSGDGSRVLPFKPSLLETAARGRIPVSFASIAYATTPGCAPASQVICWWSDMTFRRHLWELLSLPGFEARVEFGDEPIIGEDRKALAATLRAAVQGRLEPVTS